MTRALCILAACLLVASGFEALAYVWKLASRGDLYVMQWGGER